MNAKLFESNSLKGLRACILVDSEYISYWQYAALRHAMDKGLVIAAVFQCQNTTVRRNFYKNLLYYILNFISFRHKWTRKIGWQKLLGDEVSVEFFSSNWSGVWQYVPAEIIDRMRGYNLDFTIKYGMYLLKDPDNIPSKYGVFSYHHGDPDFYRGRPAGFYELLHGARSLGVMVQRLNNKLDGGEVFAFCFSKIFPHSYKKTLENSYGNGVYLLCKALCNAINNKPYRKSCGGKNYRLPGNLTVIYFFGLLFFRKLLRLFYGLFIEKCWRLCAVDSLDLLENRESIFFNIVNSFEIDKRYAFMADPIAYDSDIVFCEAMDKKSGLGVILAISPQCQLEIDMSGFGSGHFSYPFIVQHCGKKYLLPEMSNVGSQKIGLINDDLTITNITALQGLEDELLKDPTLIFFKEKWWLFAGKAAASPDALFLWYADGIHGPYYEHDLNPIVIDPYCSRPAGPIINIDDVLLRPGQDNSGSYGNGIYMSRIVQLNKTEYSEVREYDIRVHSRCGPHTICEYGKKFVIDYYRNRISFFAWHLRLKGLLRQLARRFHFR